MPAAVGLTAILKPENILINLADETRVGAVKALMANLVETKRIAKKHHEGALKLVAEREAQGSTAIGSGLAIPHARVEFASPVLAFALIRNGTAHDYKSLDREPVRFVFLIFTPLPEDPDNEDEVQTADDTHQSLLKAIITFFHNPVHCRALSGCKTVEEVWSVFIDYCPKE